MKEITFQISDALASKFELAVQLTGDNRNQVAEEFIKSYLARALQTAADEFRQPETTEKSPVQAAAEEPANDTETQNPSDFREDTQIPDNRILRAFYDLQQEMKSVTAEALRRRCSDPEGHPDTYDPQFDSNFSQMKGKQQQGKIFDEQNGLIRAWDQISDRLQKYRDHFL